MYWHGQQFWNEYKSHRSLEELREDLLTDAWYRTPTTVDHSVLYFAVIDADANAVEMLIELGEDPNLPTDNGFPLLHLAVDAARDPKKSPDSLRVIDLLLSHGADPNRLANDGTALHRAAGAGLIEVAGLLLQHGADIEARMLVDGELTPLMHAVLMDQPHMVKFLLNAGADSNARCAAYMGGMTAAELMQTHARPN